MGGAINQLGGLLLDDFPESTGAEAHLTSKIGKGVLLLAALAARASRVLKSGFNGSKWYLPCPEDGGNRGDCMLKGDRCKASWYG